MNVRWGWKQLLLAQAMWNLHALQNRKEGASLHRFGEPYRLASMGAQVTVLVVEDNALTLLVAHDILAIAGFEVLEATDAVQATLLLQDHPETRVVFSDIRLAGATDGLTLAREISSRWPGVGVILTSGDESTAGIKGGLAWRFLPKPWYPGQLLRAVGDYLRAHPLDQERGLTQ